MRTRSVLPRLRHPWVGRLAVMAVLLGLVVGVYVVVVLAGGVLIGSTDSPSVLLSVLATVVVALLFAPVQAALERSVARAGHHSVATPYDVLSRFSEDLTTGGTTDGLPGRMAKLLAEGTGAQWAQVWLVVAGRLTLAGTWPVDAGTDTRQPSVQLTGQAGAEEAGRRSMQVRHDGQLLGVLRLQERPGLALTAVEQRLFAGLVGQAGLVLRLVALQAQLEARHDELVGHADDLRASRQRLVDTQDAERRRLERDMHDGAQQHLVALAVNLRLAQAVAESSPQRAAQLLASQADAALETIATLSSLSRGIYPTLLQEAGLLVALRSALAASPTPVTVHPAPLGRLPAPVEAALYFCALEAVQNATKHSGADHVSVEVVQEDQHHWSLTVVDDGVGFDSELLLAEAGSGGLLNMADRLSAVGGTVDVSSRPGGGTSVTARVPCEECLDPAPTAPALRPVVPA
ncbi:sensor histidine kinase [Ornithinimicrobium cryptoxanthini]|uniref:histidine kinase n=1 Tax=Ornithinimicrobium cryptoxanthini TaxID=2934161 RepID=A0ABY4YFU3_9MICO|nr:ATP-binding protein [Ornithinimicrobium cryptoxanthini]USQ75643.1 histidine kinase [Ornithinimicrobium cryptoxanthini]